MYNRNLSIGYSTFIAYYISLYEYILLLQKIFCPISYVLKSLIRDEYLVRGSMIKSYAAAKQIFVQKVHKLSIFVGTIGIWAAVQFVQPFFYIQGCWNVCRRGDYFPTFFGRLVNPVLVHQIQLSLGVDFCNTISKGQLGFFTFTQTLKNWASFQKTIIIKN